MTWLRRREESFSMPLDTDTTMVPGSSRSFTWAAVDRTAKEGVAMTTRPQPFTAARSQVNFISSGMTTPFSRGFSWVVRRVSDSAW